MSKSVQDYTSFAAHIKSDRGSIRHDLRLNAKNVLRFMLVLSVSFALSATTFAQVSGVWVDWNANNVGVGTLATGGGTLTGPNGAVDGRGQGNTQDTRLGSWTVKAIYGADMNVNGVGYGSNLYIDNRTVRNISYLDVEGILTVYEGAHINDVTQVFVGGDLRNYGDMSDGNYQTLHYSGGQISVAGTLYNDDKGTANGRISNYEVIEAGNLRNAGVIETIGDLYLNVTGHLENGYNSSLYGRGTSIIRAGGDTDGQGFAATVGIHVGGNLINWYDGAIRADSGNSGLYSAYDQSGYFASSVYVDGIEVGGLLYNAGEISTYDEWTNRILGYDTVWKITAGSIHNDGRLWSQNEMTGDPSITGAALGYNGRSGYSDQAMGLIYDAAWISTTNDLINQGAHAVINASVNNGFNKAWHSRGFESNMDYHIKAMHVGGSLLNLDRASIFNYPEIIVHKDLVNRGATLVGGHWSTHSSLTGNDFVTGIEESAQQYQVGIINVGGNVNNISEEAYGDRTYGGLIASFDRFQVHGSLYNDVNSVITGSYEHAGTEPGGTGTMLVPDPDDPDGEPIVVLVPGVIEGRRASVVGGKVHEGEFNDAPSMLNVMGITANNEVAPSEISFQGLYNEGHIREIDIIAVGSNESALLYNGPVVTTYNAFLPTSNGEVYRQETVDGTAISTSGITGTITDIGEINATNLFNAGVINDIDATINVSYTMINTGTMDGGSASHVEWTYAPDGSPLERVVVLEETRASLHVGESKTIANPLTASMDTAGVGIGIINDGIIANFEHITSMGTMYHGMGVAASPGTSQALISDVTSISVGSNIGFADGADMYIAGSLISVDNVNVTNDMYLETGSMFDDVGTLTADNNVYVDGTVDGGFSVLTAKGGTLMVNSPASGGVMGGTGNLTIDPGAVASGSTVEIYGNVVNNGQLASQTSIFNRAGGSILNYGQISSARDFQNYGDISGDGMVFVGTDGKFTNRSTGSISGGIAINGNFDNAGGTIRLVNAGDVIRVTNGTATISGGSIDATAYTNANSTVVGGQYLFLSTDTKVDARGQSGPGNLIIKEALKANLSGTTGTVLDFAPVYGTWDGTKYVAGEQWGKNQYYWFEVQRAYTYGNQGTTANQESVGNYIDMVGAKVNGANKNTGLWNMLRQLDGLSDNQNQTARTFAADYADHQGDVNPLALAAVDQLSGQVYATMGVTSVHNTGVVNMTLADTLRSDVFKFSFIGNPNNAIRGQAIAPLRYNRWGTLFGVAGSTNSDGNSSGYDQSFGGMMAGIDRSFWTGTRLGAFLSVGGGEVTLEDIVQERTKTVDVMIGMYLRQEMYFGYGLMVGGFGHDTYKTTRNLTLLGHNAESRTHANIGSMYLERGIDLPVYYATLQPFASFQAVSVLQDEFTETMWDQTGQYTNAGLEGVEGKTSSFKLGLGLRGSSRPVPLQWGQLALTANMAWYHDFAGKQDRDFITKFTNPGGSNFDASLSDVTFRVYGNDPKQDWFNFGWGLHLDRNSTRFFLDANLYTNSQQTLFTGNGGIVTSW